MLIGAHLLHGHVSLAASAVALDQHAGDNEEEDEEERDSEANQYDEADCQVMPFDMLACLSDSVTSRGLTL